MDAKKKVIDHANGALDRDSSIEELKGTICLLVQYIENIHESPARFLFDEDKINKINNEQCPGFVENEVENQVFALKRLLH